MAEPTVTPLMAERHERLVLRLDALLRELRPLAVRHPEAPGNESLRATAEALLFDICRLLPRRGRVPFPAAAETLAPLVVQLGQAMAALDAFEVRHSLWSAKDQAYVWRLGAGRGQPVARLRPRLAPPAEGDRRGNERLRRELIRRIEAKADEAYARGYADAQSGKPVSP
jgi:hypothetical protein